MKVYTADGTVYHFHDGYLTRYADTCEWRQLGDTEYVVARTPVMVGEHAYIDVQMLDTDVVYEIVTARVVRVER